MEYEKLSGQIDQLLWNGIILKQGDAKRSIELPAKIAARFEVGQSVRLLFRKSGWCAFLISPATHYMKPIFSPISPYGANTRSPCFCLLP